MTNKLRVFIMNSPEEVNGVTWWRMYRPLAHLSWKYGREIEIVHNETGMIYPHHFLYTDVALCFRPCEPNHVAAMQMALDHGVPIISDFDDNVLNLPIGHSIWRIYGRKKSYVESCIAMSTQLWVSTPALKEQFRHPNTVIIPNAVFENDLPDEPAKHEGVVAWRGSEMHREDLEFGFRGEYVTMLPKIKKFLWIGYMPTWATFQNQNIKTIVQYETTWINTNQWFAYLRHQKLQAIVKPLLPCPFNDSKSNISWLEATASGAVCVGTYAGKPGWEHVSKELPRNDEQWRRQWQESRDAIFKDYNLTQWNEIRYREILRTANGDSAGT